MRLFHRHDSKAWNPVMLSYVFPRVPRPHHPEPLVRVALAGVLILASVLYLRALGEAPVNVSADEARFAVQAQSIATTGRDINGNRTPLFFHITNPLVPNNSTEVWFQPLLFYLMAAVFRLAPLSEWSTRLPTACLAILDVWLIYAVARRLFANAWYGVLAALLLALTPAHLILGRQAMDYFCPLPFALAWLWYLLLCLHTESAWLPAATGLILGVGVYSYITSWVVMPFYLAITLIVLWLAGKPLRASVALCAGFVMPLLLLIPWLWLHPTMPREIVANYKVVTSFRLAERVSLYWDYFNPSYLFFSGGSNPMWATSRAGVFLLPAAVLLPCGVWNIWRSNFSIARAVLLVGFFFAPVPILMALPEDPRYFTPRDLLAVPFGVLIGVAGVEWLAARRGPMARIVAALLILAVPMQFASFARDYFTGYQIRSAYRFDSMNFRGVAGSVTASDASARVPAVYLSDDLGEDKTVQWKFHLLARQRPDLWERTRYFVLAAFNPDDMPSGSLLVLAANNPRLNELLGPGRCSLVNVVNDVSGGPAAAILRRN
jgi:4-amino-4-deoxy-L-arabinose transferase-like glycosyltransferase